MKKLTYGVMALLAVGCDDGSGSGSGAGDGTDTQTQSSTTTTTTGAGADGSSGGQVDTTSSPGNECEDDYHGNNTVQTMLDLQLDTTNTVSIVLGDGFAATAAEQGTDELVVCGGEDDFFNFTLSCESYVSIEVRKLEGPQYPPEILLYDASSLSTMEPIDSSEGSFVQSDFFLRPVQQRLAAGQHLIQVRPLVQGKRAYSLTVTVFPTQNCT